jgi:peptidyl-prolyl cis-trans isomerase D
MAHNLRNRTVHFILLLFIGTIAAAFLFTGYDIGPIRQDVIGSVGGIPIHAREYRIVSDQQLNYFRQQTGTDRPLTTQEGQMLQQQVMQQLIQEKLIVRFGQDLSFEPSKKEIADTIEKQPVFQKDNKFDLDRYKSVLFSNGITPSEYETGLRQQMQGQEVQRLFSLIPVSDNFVNDIFRVKNDKIKISALRFRKPDLYPLITISETEIDTWMVNPENKKKVETVFEVKKQDLSISEGVQASHIVIRHMEKDDWAQTEKKTKEIASKLTAGNFAEMAKKHSDDPSSKSKGGDLGVVTRGKMIEDVETVLFELKPGSISAPIKAPYGYHILLVGTRRQAHEANLAEHMKSLSRELIQKSKTDELDAASKQKIADYKKLLAAKSALENTEETKQLKVSVVFDKEMNRYSGQVGAIDFDDKQINELFTKTPVNDVRVFENGDTVTLVKVLSKEGVPTKPDAQTLEREKSMQQMTFARKILGDLLKDLQEHRYKVKTYIANE